MSTAAPEIKRVLLVSYTFPPVGGAGVQRSAKFAKYLPHFGWQVSVLTASNPSVPLFDESLCASVPAETMIERVATWEPSYKFKAQVSAGQNGNGHRGFGSTLKSMVRSSVSALLQPDPQILWAPNAVRSGGRMLDRVPHDAVLATGPPFSSFLIGARISRRLGLPLVLDYRDEWDISNKHWENRSAQGLGHRLQQQMQARLLRRASAVLATTEASAAQIRRLTERVGSKAPVTCIYNGYDPDDFAGATPPDASDRYRITYVGTLWGLTSIEPLVKAVQRLEQIDAAANARLEIVVAGRRTEAQDTILSGLQTTSCRLTRHEYLAHDQAVGLMRASDRLCVLLSDTADAARVMPAKVFEYMATRRPLLTIAPHGEVWDVLKDHPDAGLHLPTDVEGIATSLRGAVAAHVTGATQELAFDSSRYSRIGQSEQLAALLDAAVAASAATNKGRVGR
jgi:glycosyltransferase involved in cell wall biosynthesis